MKKQKKQKLQQTPTKRNNSHDTAELTFLDHVHELRSRLFWIVATIVLASAVGFQFKDQLIAVVMDPLHGQKLVYLTPGGGFGFIFALAIYFGILIAIPVIIYHVYGFLRPLLQKASRKLVITFMLLSCVLAASGALFGYFVTIPAALSFLATFAGDAVIPNLTAESYLNFVVTYILGLAALFQLPLLLFLFDHVKTFPPGSLLASQRYVIIGSTIVAAVITPTPDVFNMAIVAVPIVVIYQLGVVAVAIRHQALKRSERRKEQAENVQSAETRLVEPITEIFKEIEAPVMQHSSSAEQDGISTGVLGESNTRASYAGSGAQERSATPRTQPGKSVMRTTDGVIRMSQPQSAVTPIVRRPHKMIVQKRAKPVRSLDGLSVLKYSIHP